MQQLYYRSPMVSQLGANAKIQKGVFLLALILGGGLLCSCGFSGGQHADSLSLLAPHASGGSAAAWTFTKSTAGKNLFIIQSPKAPGRTVFASAIKSCPVRKESPEPRPLFSGFKDVRIVGQSQASGGGSALLRTEAKAFLEETPLELIAFSAVKADCAIDVLFWQEAGDPAADSVTLISDESLADFMQALALATVSGAHD
jgi:hypothetical protein